MKVTIDNINYKGRHFEKVEMNLPQLGDFDSIPYDVFISYICETLDKYIEQEEIKK